MLKIEENIDSRQRKILSLEKRINKIAEDNIHEFEYNQVIKKDMETDAMVPSYDSLNCGALATHPQLFLMHSGQRRKVNTLFVYTNMICECEMRIENESYHKLLTASWKRIIQMFVLGGLGLLGLDRATGGMPDMIHQMLYQPISQKVQIASQSPINGAEVEKLAQSVHELEEAVLTGGATANDDNDDKIYRRLDSCLVIPPPKGKKPKAIIKLLGGTIIGAVPEVTYRCTNLLGLLANVGYLIKSVPYNVTADHSQAAREVFERFHSCLNLVLTYGLPSYGLLAAELVDLPLYSVGPRCTDFFLSSFISQMHLTVPLLFSTCVKMFEVQTSYYYLGSEPMHCIGIGDGVRCNETPKKHTLYCDPHLPNWLKRARNRKSRIVSKEVFVDLLKSCESYEQKIHLHKACELFYKVFKSVLSLRSPVPKEIQLQWVISEASKDDADFLKKKSNGNGGHRRLKKRYQSIESYDEMNVLEVDDE
ncbi:Post-SET domain-containing protein [Artemisia annua]|uniref:Post-SET domain-containing protein n=1 Tax=Artemisia annua TaxID=35608 RepID=A0A2U1MFQ8_ARTAN|nr:Post-SET domain-containing protein [Artemisia annua]